ncbi:MAG: hypothetical protein HYZ73_06715, partial [Elusimicrobia bacterium]|nr:hypothetical protein [Elusimicrobiota bacterium]
MSRDTILSVAFLWHQHQPYYKDVLANRYELPWVRLHATKDYYDMAALVEEYPAIRVTFNLVPSLLIQLEDYASGKATDPFLEVSLKPAGDLSFEDRLFLLRYFFMANWETMIYPQPRYRELLERRGRFVWQSELTRVQGYFHEQDYRDLQVWFNLAWMDPHWREHAPLVRELYEKGKHFKEEDKAGLIALQREICGLVIAKHRELMARGQAELTTSPFYHPILPLLCDTTVARAALPNLSLPKLRFQHPEDARQQVAKAIGYHERIFGRKPAGMWPPEGSVSDRVVPLLAQAGIQWIAADEGVLFHSLPPNASHDLLYQAYRVDSEGHSLQMIFRDHSLADAIGFVYASWEPQAAVNDFLKRLHAIRLGIKPDEAKAPLVTIVLDGENCWEYYRQDGQEFLRQLYKALSTDPFLRTVTVSEFLQEHPPQTTLPSLWAGSWINANFAIWIGHKEDNRAWDLLVKARQAVEEYLRAHPDQQESSHVQTAWEEIYIAEGSDWYWWYGEEFSSSHDDIFDSLFRKHLMNVYTVLSLKVPDELYVAIKGRERRRAVKPPTDFVTPKVDGHITNYFEWQGAGSYQVGPTGGAMAQATHLVSALYYGFDLESLFVRLDLRLPIEDPYLAHLRFRIIFLEPTNWEVTLRILGPERCELQLHEKDAQGSVIKTQSLTQVAAKRVVELAIPFALLPRQVGDPIEFVVTVENDDREI